MKTTLVYLFVPLTLCCSTAVSWTLFALACHPDVQAKLRAELRACPTDSPTMEQINTFPYLEGVVREALRLYAPVSGTQRVSMHDAEIPLQKPFTDKHGVLQSTVRCGISTSMYGAQVRVADILTTGCPRAIWWSYLFDC